MAIARYTDSFTFGKDTYPEWFKKAAAEGKITFQTDPSTGELLGAIISVPTKTYSATIGDTIMNLKTGMAVVPQEAAKKFSVQKEEE